QRRSWRASGPRGREHIGQCVAALFRGAKWIKAPRGALPGSQAVKSAQSRGWRGILQQNTVLGVEQCRKCVVGGGGGEASTKGSSVTRDDSGVTNKDSGQLAGKVPAIKHFGQCFEAGPLQDPLPGIDRSICRKCLDQLLQTLGKRGENLV